MLSYLEKMLGVPQFSMQQFQKVFASVLSSCLALWGCGVVPSDSVSSSSEAIADNGDLVLFYEEPADQNFDEIHGILQDTAFYDDLIAELNATYSFPQDILVFFLECGE